MSERSYEPRGQISNFGEYFERASRRSRRWKLFFAGMAGLSVLLMSLFLTGFGAITCIADNSERLCPTNWYVQYGLNLLLAIAVVSAAAIFLLTYIYRSYWRYAAREVERIRYRRVLRRSLFLLVPVCVIATTVSLVLS